MAWELLKPYVIKTKQYQTDIYIFKRHIYGIDLRHWEAARYLA